MCSKLPQTIAFCVALGMVDCSGSDGVPSNPSSGGTTGASATGGASTGDNTGGANSTSVASAVTGGANSTSAASAVSGGATATGGVVSVGGKSATGGAATGGVSTTKTSSGGVTATGGNASAGKASGGNGGVATGGKSGTGGKSATGGTSALGNTAGATTTSIATAGAGSGDVDCNATMPTNGTTYTGSNVNGRAGGLNYGIWTNGSGGSITVFGDTHAFAASWSESLNFLAHLGLDFNANKAYTEYGIIAAQFVDIKTGTSGGWSSIGMYGWMHNPCIEWYINEDSFNGLYGRGSVTATIDGATYTLSTVTTTGTGGANACESGHTGSWTQMISTRKTARQCGTITVSDHFAAWEKQGWTLGSLKSVHINVEVGGGTGSIQFPVANVTTTIK